MKIDNTNQAQGIKKANRKRKIGESEADFSNFLGAAETEDIATAGSIIGVQPMGMLEGLLSIQQVEDELMEKKKVIRQGEDILDYLDQLRHGLLRGRLSTMQVQNLVHAVKQMQYTLNDPRLKNILSDIETRAAVELAKLEMNRLL